MVTLELSKLQVTPGKEAGMQVRVTVPENPSFGVTLSATVLLVPGLRETFREAGRITK